MIIGNLYQGLCFSSTIRITCSFIPTKKLLHTRSNIEARLNIAILQICQVHPHEIDSSVADKKSRSANLGSIRSCLHRKEHCLMPSSRKLDMQKMTRN